MNCFKALTELQNLVARITQYFNRKDSETD